MQEATPAQLSARTEATVHTTSSHRRRLFGRKALLPAGQSEKLSEKAEVHDPVQVGESILGV
jgi:hypothetical protein